jgi:hypothetical protein
MSETLGNTAIFTQTADVAVADKKYFYHYLKLP